MEYNIIKNVVLALLTYYSNFKIINKKIEVNIRKICFVIICGTISGIIKCEVNKLLSIVILIITISSLFRDDNIGNSIIITIISLGINYAIGATAIMMSFVVNKIFQINNDIIELIIMLIFYLSILQGIFKIKKFKYGISFLQRNVKNESIDVVILNIGVIILFLGMQISNSSGKMASTIGVEIIISAIIMFITIKKSLNLYYKQKLLVQELDETKAELDNKNKEIKELEEENLTFKKRSHSLIHQQKSLEYKIEQMMMQTEISKELAGEVKERLEKIGDEIYKEKENIELDKTGITEIDDMLKYMQSECNKNKIEFILKLEGNIHQMTNNAIPKEELEILLSDHIKNAIIAIKHTENINRTIMVKLGKIDAVYGISIYDSGAEFEKETLDNLGKRPSTTHADEGGTGMGFMNTFGTLKKYEASLIIEEYNKPSKDNYTKVINIKFDKKNEFKIKSYRR